MSASDASPQLPQGNVLGLPVTVGTIEQVSSAIIRLATKAPRGYVCVANAHMLSLARREPPLERTIRQAAFVTSDGMPVVASLRLQGRKGASRVAGVDLMASVCSEAARQSIPIYLFGGRPEAISVLRKDLVRQYPELVVAGDTSPPDIPVNPPFDQLAVADIRGSGARIVFVGLGCPKQEYWMSVHAEHLDCVMIGVGAAFDFLAGTRPRAPHWMQVSGLEWLHRLLSEPKRLWKRYLIYNTLFCIYSSAEVFEGLARYLSNGSANRR